MKTTVIALAALALAGCVSKGKYDDAVAQTALTRAELGRSNATLERSRADLQARDDELRQRQEEITSLQAQIDEMTRDSQTFATNSAAQLTEMRARLADLKAAQAAAESRAALFRQLALRLKKQVDAGDLSILVRDGRMVLVMSNDVLFDTGRTEIKPAGKEALAAVAGVLSTLPNRQFQVAGHTDDVPIHNDRFASNWELSSGRALGVVHFLVSHGVSPATLSAAGYGEHDPVSLNDGPEGRKRNRRTEITLQPNIDELVRVP